jgi:hypothetical protein
MALFETILDSKKRRIPCLPKFFSLIGYNPFRFPHVFNYFSYEGFVVYVQKNRHGYSVVTDGWIFSSTSPYDCSFKNNPPVPAYSGLTHVDALLRYADVCSRLMQCYVFDVVLEPRYEIALKELERIAYECHSPSDAEVVIADKVSYPGLFDELS